MLSMDEPLVIYYNTHSCPFCKIFYPKVLHQYVLRKEINMTAVDVVSGRYTKYMRDLRVMMPFESSLVHDYVIAGNMNRGGPSVPCVRIISPSDLRNMVLKPWIAPEYHFIFPEGRDNNKFYALVRRAIGRHIKTKAYVPNKMLARLV